MSHSPKRRDSDAFNSPSRRLNMVVAAGNSSAPISSSENNNNNGVSGGSGRAGRTSSGASAGVVGGGRASRTTSGVSSVAGLSGNSAQVGAYSYGGAGGGGTMMHSAGLTSTSVTGAGFNSTSSNSTTNTKKVFHQGWVEKTTSVLKRWVSRHLRLEGDEVSYAPADDAPVKGTMKLVKIERFAESAPTVPSDVKDYYGMLLHGEKDEKWLIRCTSEPFFEEWYAKLKCVLYQKGLGHLYNFGLPRIDERTLLHFAKVPLKDLRAFIKLENSVIYFFSHIVFEVTMFTKQPADMVVIVGDSAVYLCDLNGSIVRCLVFSDMDKIFYANRRDGGMWIGIAAFRGQQQHQQEPDLLVRFHHSDQAKEFLKVLTQIGNFTLEAWAQMEREEKRIQQQEGTNQQQRKLDQLLGEKVESEGEDDDLEGSSSPVEFHKLEVEQMMEKDLREGLECNPPLGYKLSIVFPTSKKDLAATLGYGPAEGAEEGRTTSSTTTADGSARRGSNATPPSSGTPTTPPVVVQQQQQQGLPPRGGGSRTPPYGSVGNNSSSNGRRGSEELNQTYPPPAASSAVHSPTNGGRRSGVNSPNSPQRRRGATEGGANGKGGQASVHTGYVFPPNTGVINSSSLNSTTTTANSSLVQSASSPMSGGGGAGPGNMPVSWSQGSIVLGGGGGGAGSPLSGSRRASRTGSGTGTALPPFQMYQRGAAHIVEHEQRNTNHVSDDPSRIDDMRTFLTRIGLGATYESFFRNAGVDYDVLMTASPVELLHLGVKNAEHRSRILQEVVRIKKDAAVTEKPFAYGLMDPVPGLQSPPPPAPSIMVSTTTTQPAAVAMTSPQPLSGTANNNTTTSATTTTSGYFPASVTTPGGTTPATTTSSSATFERSQSSMVISPMRTRQGSSLQAPVDGAVTGTVVLSSVPSGGGGSRTSTKSRFPSGSPRAATTRGSAFTAQLQQRAGSPSKDTESTSGSDLSLIPPSARLGMIRHSSGGSSSGGKVAAPPLPKHLYLRSPTSTDRGSNGGGSGVYNPNSPSILSDLKMSFSGPPPEISGSLLSKSFAAAATATNDPPSGSSAHHPATTAVSLEAASGAPEFLEFANLSTISTDSL